MSAPDRQNGRPAQGGGRIVVVGAGLAGLATAWRLHARGHAVQVLERRGRAGGGVDSRWHDGFCFDAALETASTHDRHLNGFIGELGLGDQLLPLRPAQLVQLHQGQVVSIDPQRLGGLAAIAGVSRRDALRLLRWRRLFGRYRPLLEPTHPERAADLDFRSSADFARLYFGDTAFDRWVSPEATAVYGGSARELSRVATLLHWVRVGMGQERTAIHGVVRGGLQSLVDEANERLDVRCGVEVTRVIENAGGAFSLECGTREGRKGVLEADAVVLATSAAEACRLAGPALQPAERDTLSAVKTGPSLTLAAAVSRPLAGMPQLVRVPHAEGHVIDACLVEPGIAEGRAPVGASIVTLRASDRFAEANAGAADDVIEKGLVDALTRLCPDARGHVLEARLTRRAAATPRFEVGAYRALARFARVQADRRELGRALYFAGDYLIGPDAESKVISGFRAARDIVADQAR